MDDPIVRRWGMRVNLLLPESQHRKGQRTSLQSVLDATCSALLLELSARSLQTVLSLLTGVLDFTSFSSYRRFRPQVAVCEEPRLWWRHAARAVVQELRNLRKEKLALQQEPDQRGQGKAASMAGAAQAMDVSPVGKKITVNICSWPLVAVKFKCADRDLHFEFGKLQGRFCTEAHHMTTATFQCLAFKV